MDKPQIALEFDQVSLHFGDVTALKNVSFAVTPGETLILLGAAGSGKTTLLKTALGLLRADSGRIVLFGRDVTAIRESEWFDVRSRIGVLFQEGGLFDSLTIGENVAYPLRNQKQLRCAEEEIPVKVERSLQFVELGHTLEKVPSELSGGMRRRAGIARAIVSEPALLLYDSPTAGLDPITATNIIALIVKGRDVQNATTVMATHRFQDGQVLARYEWDAATGGLRVANGSSRAAKTRYLVLKEGEVVFLGSPAELETSQDPYVSKFVAH